MTHIQIRKTDGNGHEVLLDGVDFANQIASVSLDFHPDNGWTMQAEVPSVVDLLEIDGTVTWVGLGHVSTEALRQELDRRDKETTK